MPTHHARTAESEAPPAPSSAPPTAEARFALLMELEHFALNGRRAAYELLRDALKEHRVSFTPAHFSRYCLRATPDFYVADLLEAVGASDVAPEKFLEDVKNGLDAFFASPEGRLSKAVVNLLDEAHGRGMAVGILSALPRPKAETLMDLLGLKERGAQLFTFDDVEAQYPRADTWLKIAKAMAKSPRACVVFASHAQACRAALAAGMHCIAVPDEFTAFQDFSGADLVLEALNEKAPGELLDAVLPRVA